jgi:arylsulfatase A-like enzyme
MTGLHGGHARVRGNKDVPLRAEDVTVAELLKSAGYTTGLVGKWGLGETASSGAPNKKGFDFFYGFVNQTHAHNSYPTYLWRNDQKVTLKNVLPPDKPTKHGEGVSTEQVEFAPDLFVREAGEFIKQNKDKPFFLYFATTAPHANNEGKQKGMEVPSDEPYAGKDWPAMEKKRAALTTRLDDHVGKLLGLLDELKLADDTLVIFSSDNGPHSEGGSKSTFFKSSGPLRGQKRNLKEGGIRVPFIARWPGKIKAGTSEAVICFWDFLPTAAEIAGASDKLPKNIDGQSIVPALLGKEIKPPEYLYFEFHEKGFDQAIRFGDWKAIRVGFNQPIELYDLKTDLGETKNVGADHPDVIKRAEEIFGKARVDSADFPINKQIKKPAANDQQ